MIGMPNLWMCVAIVFGVIAIAEIAFWAILFAADVLRTSIAGRKQTFFEIGAEPWVLDEEDMGLLERMDDPRSPIGKPTRHPRAAQRR